VQFKKWKYLKTYLKGPRWPRAGLTMLYQVRVVKISQCQIQLPSIALHYPAKYFWHLTEISYIKGTVIQ
jgi:hypothetical protein